MLYNIISTYEEINEISIKLEKVIKKVNQNFMEMENLIENEDEYEVLFDKLKLLKMSFSFKIEPNLAKIKKKTENKNEILDFVDNYNILIKNISNFKEIYEKREKNIKEEMEKQAKLLKNEDLLKTRKKNDSKNIEPKKIFKDIIFFFLEDNYEEFISLKNERNNLKKEIFENLYKKFCTKNFCQKEENKFLFEEQFRIFTNFTFQEDDNDKIYNKKYQKENNYYKEKNFFEEQNFIEDKTQDKFQKKNNIMRNEQNYITFNTNDNLNNSENFINDKNFEKEDFDHNFPKEDTLKEELNHVVLNEILDLDSLPISIKSDEEFSKNFNFEDFKNNNYLNK